MSQAVGVGFKVGQPRQVIMHRAAMAGSENARSRLPLRRLVGVVIGVMVAVSVVGSPAWADGADAAPEGYVLVQQALGGLAQDPNPMGVHAAMEKVDAALATKDQQGVNVAQLKQAETALQAGRVQVAQGLLQQSITAPLARLGPATGEQTGTTVVLVPLAGRGALTAQDWGFGIASLLMALVGIALAVRFAPADNFGQLRRRLAVAKPRRLGAQS